MTTSFRPAMFLPLNRLQMPESLLTYLRVEEREVFRHMDSWSRTDELSKLSAVDESLAFRIAIYDRLPGALEKVRRELSSNYDLVKGELGVNRVACLLVRSFIHAHLRHYNYATGLAAKILSSREAASLRPEAVTLFKSTVEVLLMSLEPSTALDFSARLGPLVSSGQGSKLTLLTSMVRVCDSLTKSVGQDALQYIRAARQKAVSDMEPQIEGAFHYLEALSYKQLSLPAEEFHAFKKWLGCLGGSIGQAALEAKVDREFEREAAMLAGAVRLRELAEAEGDRATVLSLADDLHRHGYAFASATKSAPDEDLRETDDWQLFPLPAMTDGAVKKAIADLIPERRSRLAFISIEIAYATMLNQSFPKAAIEDDLAGIFRLALEKELDASNDQITHVTTLSKPDERGNRWIVCQRDTESVYLGIRLSNLGDHFRVRMVPLLALPQGIPDEAWIKLAEKDISYLRHGGNLWQGDMDKVVEHAARSMTPSLAPLEVSRGTIREMD